MTLLLGLWSRSWSHGVGIRVMESELELKAIMVVLELESESVGERVLTPTLTPTTIKELYKHDVDVMWSNCLSNESSFGLISYCFSSSFFLFSFFSTFYLGLVCCSSVLYVEHKHRWCHLSGEQQEQNSETPRSAYFPLRECVRIISWF